MKKVDSGLLWAVLISGQRIRLLPSLGIVVEGIKVCLFLINIYTVEYCRIEFTTTTVSSYDLISEVLL